MKKVRIFLATLFFIVVNVCTMQAVTNYPIQLTAQVLPPYGTCLSDYVVGGMERINITALQRDLTLSMYEINLQMQVKQGTKVILKSNSKYQLRPGIITKLPAAALFSALSDVDASTKYKENGFCFPEGAYEFVFQAFDARNSKLPVSEPVYFFAYLNKTQPPYCVFPADNACVDYSTQDVNFVWVEPTVAMPTNNKRYALEVYEMPDGFDPVRDNATSVASSLSPIYSKDDIDGVTTMHPLHQAAGLFIKGRSYAWRVRTYSVKNRMVNSESKLYNTSDYVENNGYSKFSTFHFKKCVGQDDIWKKEDKKVLTCDLTLKPVIEKVDTANSKAVVVWKKEEDKFTCGYIVEWNLIDTLAAPWGQVKVPVGESQYELKNLKKGVKYITRVRGLVCPKSGSSDTIYSAYSDTLHFQLKKENESDCGHPVPGLSSTVSLKSALSNGSWITANGHDIKVLTCTMDVAGGDTTFTGTGLVSYGFLTNLVSLTVKFDKVKINEQNELMQGMVYCNTDKDNCLDFNLNGQANKKSAGSGPASLQESKLQTYDNASQMPNGSVGIVGDNVVAKDESGKTQEIGKEQKDEPGSCAPKTSCYDDQAAFVSFAPQEQWNPPFDAEQGIFTKSLSISDYYDKIERHTIPWIAMPAGETNKIYANLKIEPGSGVKPEDVYFICRSKNQTVRLKATQDGDSRFIVPIYGGEEGKCLEIVAMADTVKAGNAACSQLFTLGRAKVMSMKKETITLHIVPFRRDKSKVDGVSIENTLNTIYKPLGKTFKVEVEERFGDGEEYDFVEDGLSVEGSGFMKTETEEMSMLKSLYNMEIGFSEEDNQAYLFVLPKAGTDGVLGDMPRNKPVGYVFADPSSVYADGHTVAHEIGHGIFTFDHAFEYYSGDQGQTSNLMDYTQGGQNNDLKVWQWSVMDTHKNYVLPFLEGDEDGMYKPWSFVDGPILSELPELPGLPLIGNKKYYAFFDPNGRPLMLPSTTKTLRFNSNGSIVSFVDENGETWVAVVYSGTSVFIAYYKNAKATKKKADGSYVVNTTQREKYRSKASFTGTKIYVPISNYEDCPSISLYSIEYGFSDLADKDYKRSKEEMEDNVKKLKNFIFGRSGEEIIGKLEHYTDFNYNVNCLSESVRRFYLFMTNYYNCFKSDNNAEGNRMYLYNVLKTYDEVRVFGIDVEGTQDYCEMKSAVDQPNVWNQINVSPYYSDNYQQGVGTLYVKFENLNIYKDYNLSNTGRCTEEQWNLSLSELDKLKEQKSISDFCKKFLEITCSEWIKNLPYEKTQEYIDFIVNQSIGDNKKGSIKENAEKALLLLFNSIRKEEMSKFIEYLTNNQYEKLYLFLKEFDDVSINPFDGDNYTFLIKSFVKLYHENFEAFSNYVPVDEWEMAGKLFSFADESFIGQVRYTVSKNSNGNLTLWRSSPDYSNPISTQYGTTYPQKSEVVNGLKDVSPFMPIFIEYDPTELKTVSNGFYNGANSLNYNTGKAKYYMCPLFFMLFRQDKIFNDNIQTVVSVAIDLTTIATGFGVYGAALKLAKNGSKIKKAIGVYRAVATLYTQIEAGKDIKDNIKMLKNATDEVLKATKELDVVNQGNVADAASILEAVLSKITDEKYNAKVSIPAALATAWHLVYVGLDSDKDVAFYESLEELMIIDSNLRELGIDRGRSDNLLVGQFISSIILPENEGEFNQQRLKKIMQGNQFNSLMPSLISGHRYKMIISRSDYKDISKNSNRILKGERKVYYAENLNPFEDFYSVDQGKYMKVPQNRYAKDLKTITGLSEISNSGYAILTFTYLESSGLELELSEKVSYDNMLGNYILPGYIVKNVNVSSLYAVTIEKFDKNGELEDSAKIDE